MLRDRWHHAVRRPASRPGLRVFRDGGCSCDQVRGDPDPSLAASRRYAVAGVAASIGDPARPGMDGAAADLLVPGRTPRGTAAGYRRECTRRPGRLVPDLEPVLEAGLGHPR